MSLIIMLLSAFSINLPAAAQPPTDTTTPQPSLTQPLLYIESYSPGSNDGVSPWAPFNFTFVLANNSDADILVLDKDLQLQHVWARGTHMVENGKPIVFGTFEKR